ncbi:MULTISPECIES: 2-isopropylmalate synthase [Deinococcus]|uniref:2-isopropylmalate synthase n=1 Tax=Deinococcus geothermalis (strain DSM 11300 / CIP 105573 / AG-3a) TaxID=319795 RepID=Q1J0T3_DEIGD|nr:MULTISPECIES: 2-isopropylmalate synthase [Deinococcus]ABF44901.1 2-isopropylmalate synthase [Deinococcus geothermalis DSM 11300]MBI0446182.1 2-isopropylmalate synthase [Deinococcus sp. DB0503]TDE85715.1 2-isopropylmalate synthase [Deinococcus sp. S9]
MTQPQAQAQRIRIFDTTLRDGEQSPGVALNHTQKLEIAHQLARLGVDVIEAGFPIASPGDLEGVSRIAREVRGPIIAGLARAGRADIEAAARAVELAEKPRIHTFIATSPIHMAKKLQLEPDAVIERAVEAVRLARSFVDDVEFSAEDATRSDRDFLVRIFRAAVEAGATTINVPDTVGYTTPEEIRDLFAYLRGELPDHIILSAHCHDDLGMAVANSIAAAEGGARQIECTVNGIGERAGNASLEEIVMAFHTRRDHYGFETGIRTREIYRTSRMVSRLSGMPVQPNKAVVGDNAFAHESGIHQDGVIKARETYEIMNAELVGREAAVLVMGKHSGRAAFRKALTDLGYAVDEERLKQLFARFKDMADRKGQIYADDLRALVESRSDVPQTFTLEGFQITSGMNMTPVAFVRLQTPDGPVDATAHGDGPVEAAFQAINKITGITPTLESYRIQAVTGGGDALGEVSIGARYGETTLHGTGVATDVVEASARAWIRIVNQVVAGMGKSRAVSQTTV